MLAAGLHGSPCIKQNLLIIISCNKFPPVTNNMNIFSIRDIENMTGIKAHTLRIWEQRAQYLQSKKKGKQTPVL